MAAMSRTRDNSFPPWRRRPSLPRAALAAAAMILTAAGCASDRGPLETGKTGPHGLSVPQKAVASAAGIAESRGDYGLAVQYYRRIQQLRPDVPDFKLGVARNLRYASNTEDARLYMELLVGQGDDGPRFLTELGKAQIADGRSMDAVETLNAAIGQAPDLWQARSALGIAYDRLELFEQAQESYRAALDSSPENPIILNNLALSLAISGKLGESVSILSGLVRRSGATAQMRQNLAMLRAVSGDEEGAAQISRQDLSEQEVLANLKYYQSLVGAPRGQ